MTLKKIRELYKLHLANKYMNPEKILAVFDFAGVKYCIIEKEGRLWWFRYRIDDTIELMQRLI